MLRPFFIAIFSFFLLNACSMTKGIPENPCKERLLVRNLEMEFSYLPKENYPRLFTITFLSDMFPRCLDFYWWEPIENSPSNKGIEVRAEEDTPGFYQFTIDVDLLQAPAKPFTLSISSGGTNVESQYFLVIVNPKNGLARISEE